MVTQTEKAEYSQGGTEHRRTVKRGDGWNDGCGTESVMWERTQQAHRQGGGCICGRKRKASVSGGVMEKEWLEK